jgi:protein EFR3
MCPAVERSSNLEILRGDGVSPLFKISPALMHIENLSLQSLTRSARSVGVTDLRDALEGRSSVSNPALAGPPSVSTTDYQSSLMGSDMHVSKPTPTRSRSKKRVMAPRPGEVRDVLNRLGIGKQTGSSLLKNSFPALQKSDQR